RTWRSMPAWNTCCPSPACAATGPASPTPSLPAALPIYSDAPFDLDDVARTLNEKMVRRHPHVCGDAVARTPEEVLTHWNAAKAADRKSTRLNSSHVKISYAGFCLKKKSRCRRPRASHAK